MGTMAVLVLLFYLEYGKGDGGMEQALSVGIDIGTTTTQLVLTRLLMEDTSGYFSVPKVSIIGKEIVYKGGIHFTPLLDDQLIDLQAVRSLVSEEFRRAGYAPGDTSLGAVIITGEAARKENAAAVLEALSGFAGDFVVSAAGPDLESVIAGKGSGAQQYSADHHCTAVNLDIGGGTTNIAVFSQGEVQSLGCYDIGGRLVRLRPDMTLEAVSPSAALIASARGLALGPGQRAGRGELDALALAMARLLEEALGLGEPSPLLEQVRTPGSSVLCPPGDIEAIFFSGGVAESVYRPAEDPFRYGDIGCLLGEAVGKSRLTTAFRPVPAGETIRATVVGAGSYTTTLSGSTIDCDDRLLPLKNVPVLKLTAAAEDACFEGRPEPLAEALRHFRAQTASDLAAVALRGRRNPSYPQLKDAARAIAQGAAPDHGPLLLLVEEDMAKALGQLLRPLLPAGQGLLVLDCLRASEHDFLDIGRPVAGGLAVPVVVKTLVFGRKVHHGI